MKTITLLLNGRLANDETLRFTVRELREKGYRICVRPLWEPGQATEWAHQEAERGTDIVVAGGGDGTINEVVNGLMASNNECALGIIPGGTANDFANGQGIPLGDPRAALELIAATDPRPIDIGMMNDHYFINVASGGLGAKITATAPPLLKRLFGGAAYSMHGVVTLVSEGSQKIHITLDGERIEESVLFLVVANSHLAGGGKVVAKDAEIDDGYLDVAWLPDLNQVNPIDFMSDVFLDEGFDFQAIRYHQVKTATLEGESELWVNADGEPCKSMRFDYRCAPKRLPVILPKKLE